MKKRSLSLLRFIILFVVVGALYLGLRNYYENRESVTYSAPLNPVRVVKAEVRDIEQSISFTSYIESEKMVPVVPFVSGTIIEYSAELGDRVKKDDVICRIDSEPYRLQRAQAEAQAKVYESTYERMKNLYEANAVTLQDLEGVEAQRNAANAQLDLANLQLSYADVKAPIDGTIIMNKGTVGSIGTNTDYVAIIADMENLILNLQVSASYYDTIVNNLDNLDITVRDNSRSLESKAKIVAYAPFIDPLSRNFSLKLKLDNPENFTIGSSVSVEIVYDKLESVYTLPLSILRLDGTLYYIEGESARLLTYSPSVQNDEYFLAPSGYEDVLFVSEGANTLFDGERVRILED